MQTALHSVETPVFTTVPLLDALRLAHVKGPVICEKVLGVTRHHPHECEYAIGAPANAGMPLETLRAYLHGSSDPLPAEPFTHPYFEGDEQCPLGSLSPLFCEDMTPPDFTANADGLTGSSRDARYLLVARNDAGQPAGYIQFRVSLFPTLDDMSGDSETVRTAGLIMTLDRVFVRKSDRGVGIGTAMLEKAGFVFWSELKELALQIRNAATTEGRSILLRPYVMSTWHSWAGKMAHYRLVDLATQYRDAAQDDFASHDFRIEEVCEHGQY
jgi:GNAT superfamily N-acetyltransferase